MAVHVVVWLRPCFIKFIRGDPGPDMSAPAGVRDKCPQGLLPRTNVRRAPPIPSPVPPDAEDLLADAGVDLRVRLRRAGLSQQDLARHLGVSAAFLSAALGGKKPWPPGMRVRAEAFVAGGVEGLVAWVA